MFGPVLRGWTNYYGRFYPSAMQPLWRHVNDYLVRWMQRKYKRLARGVIRAARALGRVAGTHADGVRALGKGIRPCGSMMGAG